MTGDVQGARDDRRQRGALRAWLRLAFGRRSTEVDALRQDLDLLRERFHASFDRAPVGVAIVDLDGRIRLANGRLRELLGATDATRARLDEVFPDEEIPRLTEVFEGLISGDVDHVVLETQLLHADGSAIWCRIAASTLVDASGQPDGIVGHVQDISVERQALEDLHSQAHWFSSVLERLSDMVVLFDRDGRITWASPSTAAIVASSPDDLIGQPVLDFVHRDDRAAVTAAISRARAGEPARVEFRVRNADGGWIWLESTAADLLDDPDVAAMITISRDVTERHEAAAELAHQATHDPLTGLLNRIALEVQLNAGLERSATTGEPVAVAFLDLDHFKSVNDHHGHRVGDALLRSVAGCLRAEVRAGDLIGRLGGDEFIVVLWGADFADALAIAERIRRTLHVSGALPGVPPEVEVSASIGLTVATADRGQTVESILHDADAALYEAKRGGRNRIEVAEAGLERIDGVVDALLRGAGTDPE